MLNNYKIVSWSVGIWHSERLGSVWVALVVKNIVLILPIFNVSIVFYSYFDSSLTEWMQNHYFSKIV